MTTAIDHIITNVIIDTYFKTGILKSSISVTLLSCFQIVVKKMCVTNQNKIFTTKFLMSFNRVC